MMLLIQYTLIFASVLVLVALGGCISEHSGVINLGLEGIMVIGALGGALMMKYLPAGSSAFVTIVLTVLGIIAGLVLGCIMGSITVGAIEPSTATFVKDIDWIAVLVGVIGSALLALIMSLIICAESVDTYSSDFI